MEPIAGALQRRIAMKTFFFGLLLMTGYLVSQTPANPQPGSPQDGAGQQPVQQQSNPAAPSAPATPQSSAPSGQPNAGAATRNVAATLHVYAYPNSGQTPEKQSKDETECYQSAQNAAAGSGQEPAQPSQASNAGKGQTAKGSAGGAATGAAIGAVAGDAGQGAAIGAIGGAAVGHRRKKKAEQAAKGQEKQQQQAQEAQAADNMKRAYTACMESRNYTVK